MTSVQAGLDRVRARIATAAAASGRPADAVSLIAVSKTQPAARVIQAIDSGQREFGENYLQDALPKMDELVAHRDLVWHFIGTLQSNKTRIVAERFDWVHTVDRLKLIARLDAQRPPHTAPLNICLQIRVDGDDRDSGVPPDQALELADAVASKARLRLRGLMVLPPPSANAEAARPSFAMARELMEALRAAGHELDTLSMGMTDDLEVAIDEGATLVRIGTAIFGARSPDPNG